MILYTHSTNNVHFCTANRYLFLSDLFSRNGGLVISGCCRVDNGRILAGCHLAAEKEIASSPARQGPRNDERMEESKKILRFCSG